MINIDETYINKMLEKHPLLQEDNPEDKRDYTLDNLEEDITCTSERPSKYHIRYDYMPYKPKQKNVSACCACAGAEACMIQLFTDKKLSWQFGYANRQASDFQGKGMYIRQLLQGIKDYGLTLLDLFNVMKNYPEIKEDLDNAPNRDAIFKEAANNKITGYLKVRNLDEAKDLISQDIPVLIGVKVYSSFYNAPNNDYVVPEPNMDTENKVGNHEMLLVGYDDSINKVFALNHWDDEWDYELKIDYDTAIINDLYMITDKPVVKPVVKTYTVGWNLEKSLGNKGWWYSPDGKTYYTNRWEQIDGYWYYFDDKGYALENTWFLYSKDNKWYYLEPNTCHMATNRSFYVDSNGAMN